MIVSSKFYGISSSSILFFLKSIVSCKPKIWLPFFVFDITPFQFYIFPQTKKLKLC